MTGDGVVRPPAGYHEVALFDGRVTTFQPAKGYRSAIDPILMQAAVPARGGEPVLDLGCGAGAAALCLAARLPEAVVDGLDFQNELLQAASAGAAVSGLADRARFHEGDILEPPAALPAGSHRHVMANPPFEREGTVRPSPDPVKARATVEGRAKLADWVQATAAFVPDGGTVTFIHRGDRLEELADLMAAAVGGLAILPIFAREGESRPIRGIVQGRKGAGGGVIRLDPLFLHETGGNYRPEADHVLRGGGLAAFPAE